jgi:hypothetical protein
MTINCYKAHRVWIREFDNGIWICELCIEKKRIAMVDRARLVMAKAKAAEMELDPVRAAGGAAAYMSKALEVFKNEIPNHA